MTECKIADARSVRALPVTVDGAESVTIRWLISERDGARRFQMRLFELGPGGRTPYHRHDWEHEVFIIEGSGKLLFEGDERPFQRGYFIFVPEGSEHAFVNTGSVPLEFLCMIPVHGDKP
jgi:quercetin dioxygenase-like cupin family protein